MGVALLLFRVTSDEGSKEMSVLQTLSGYRYLFLAIVEAYYPLFKKFEQMMLSLRGNSPKNYGIRK